MKKKIVTALILSMTITSFAGIPVRAEEVQEETFAQEAVSEGQRNENLEGVVQEELGEEGLRLDEPDEAGPQAEESETELCIERDTEKPGHWVLDSTGWWYVYDDGTWPAGGIVSIQGTDYAFDASGYMVTGWYLSSEGWYYFQGNGAKATGWLLLGNTWYYLDGSNEELPGLMVENCKKVIGDVTYFFAAGGAMQTGWVLRPEGWYYTSGSGAMQTGWNLIGGAWYYLDGENQEYPGLMSGNGWNVISGQNYYMTESGAMASNWLLQPEGWYYLGGDGARKTGWNLIGGAWYYLDGENQEYPGLMRGAGWNQIDDQWYYMNGNGSMASDWVLRPEGWYYLGGDGAKKTGWNLVGGAWYYLDGENQEYPGLMRGAGWNLIGEQWYYMNGNGSMASGWLLLGNTWYYLGGDGAMKTGWQWIGNHWYYLYEENDVHGGSHGAMAVNTVIDGWTIMPSGIAVQDIEGKIEEIKKYIYVPYRYGGTTPSGWDCSGFTQWALHYLGGVTIPRTSYQQAAGGVNIDKNNRNVWRPGDILVYQSGSGFSHVALYLGDGMLMHALSARYGTIIQGVDYYEQWDRGTRLALVRRYL